MKPWTLRSTFPELVSIFSHCCLCDKSHVHDLAAGCETAKTAFYPQMMCDMIHQSFRAYVGYHTSDPSPPAHNRPVETDEDREAWVLDEAKTSTEELDARFEPEPAPVIISKLVKKLEIAGTRESTALAQKKAETVPLTTPSLHLSLIHI